MLIGLLSGAVLVSALVLAALSFFVVTKPLWLLFGFEVVTAAAGALGVLFAMGRFQDGQGLALTCVSATIAVASFLGCWFVLGRAIAGSGGSATPANYFLLARLAAAVVLGLVGALTVLSRNPKSWSYLLRAAATGVPLVVGLGAAFVGRARISAAIAGMPGWASAGVLIFAAVVGMILLCASAHFLIRAFEMGRVDEKPA